MSAYILVYFFSFYSQRLIFFLTSLDIYSYLSKEKTTLDFIYLHNI